MNRLRWNDQRGFGRGVDQDHGAKPARTRLKLIRFRTPRRHRQAARASNRLLKISQAFIPRASHACSPSGRLRAVLTLRTCRTGEHQGLGFVATGPVSPRREMVWFTLCAAGPACFGGTCVLTKAGCRDGKAIQVIRDRVLMALSALRGAGAKHGSAISRTSAA
jgi:hypothetical protein